MFCPECGVDHHADEREVQAAIDREVEIARINAKRDVEVARIGARMQAEELDTAEKIAKTEAEADVVAAVAEAEVVGAAIEAGAISSEPEPLVIDAPAIPDDAPADAPPEVEGSAPPESHRKSRGLGMW